jgi:hypothetical protein
MKLKRSNDRKTTPMANAMGDQSKIKNTFGLPAGKEFSCVGETPFCGAQCYGKRIENYLPSVRALLEHNWSLVKSADYDDLVFMLNDMIVDFVKDCDKHGAEKLFRIHWDGDFFSTQYTRAWRAVVTAHPDVQFWVYTRNKNAAAFLATNQPTNLALYFSADQDNQADAAFLRKNFGIKIATLATTFEEARVLHKDITGTRVGRCPEVAGRIPLITTEGGACKTCALCPTAKTDITFATSSK